MKLTKRKTCLSLMSLSILASMTAIAVFNSRTSINQIKQSKANNNSDYALALSSSNGRITDTSYSDSIKTIDTAKTTSNLSFSMSYYHAKGKTGSYCVVDANNPRTNENGADGYIYTTNGVNGLDDIVITFSYENGVVPGDLLVYFSNSTSFIDSPVVAESGLPITASGSYFKIQALSQSVIIDSVQINYSCDGNSHVYPAKAVAEHASKAETDLLPTYISNALPQDFAYGVDLSEVAEIEQLGGYFYNENDVKEDPFKIFADDGANYARIRLWADPYSANGNPYGGGTNDLATDVHLAKRAKAHGMKVLLDLHYSDFWTDPDSQWKPKSWDVANASTVSTYTTNVMNAFKDAGVTLDSVQVGNEINSAVAGVSQHDQSATYYAILRAGVDAVKSVFPQAKTVIHFTNIPNKNITTYIDAMCSQVPNFDVLGVSYYPYWHGGLDNLLSVLNHIADKGKEAMVLETSYGFTLDWNDYANNDFNQSDADTAGYSVSAQGQMDALCAIINVLSKVNNSKGTGIFYWGSDYIPVPNLQWATDAGQYYDANGVDGTGTGGKQSWSNQALFDYNYKVLGSAQTYKLVKANDQATVTIELYSKNSPNDSNLAYVVLDTNRHIDSDWINGIAKWNAMTYRAKLGSYYAFTFTCRVAKGELRFQFVARDSNDSYTRTISDDSNWHPHASQIDGDITLHAYTEHGFPLSGDSTNTFTLENEGLDYCDARIILKLPSAPLGTPNILYDIGHTIDDDWIDKKAEWVEMTQIDEKTFEYTLYDINPETELRFQFAAYYNDCNHTLSFYSNWKPYLTNILSDTTYTCTADNGFPETSETTNTFWLTKS